ncbi:TIGR03086 family metal-binding protein [Nonomuraea sp. LPB2021202275-12-8]|uniref:TIGR03086 family metal-binding protein n=1 Tax=Nonomuraea sp. LPB2021202275-12-8 TaxID=3120159 RepID=UPI00300CD161
MTAQDSLAGLVRGKSLTERATGFVRYAVSHVTTDDFSRPTPCDQWDLRTLLSHVNDSLATLSEGLENGRLGLEPDVPSDGGGDVLAVFRQLTNRLLESWICSGHDGDDRMIEVAGTPLHSLLLGGTGALEIAVHGWDIATACGVDCVIPTALATDLYDFARIAVSPDSRHPQFAEPVPVPESATPADRLVAYLGRDPRMAFRRAP